MRAIVDQPEEECIRLYKVTENLKECLGSRWNKSKLFDDFHQVSGYAHYTFFGTVSEDLIQKLGRMPTEEEIIILVDDGFSHFGASCSITGKAFRGRVNTD